MNKHLSFSRTQFTAPRRRSGGGEATPPPPNTNEFSQRLKRQLAEVREERSRQTELMESRLVVKIELNFKIRLSEFEKVDGITIISDETDKICIFFMTEEALRAFEAKLSDLGTTGKTTHKNLVFALENFSQWRSGDRLGKSLPTALGNDSIMVDVELVPKIDDFLGQLSMFRNWVEEIGATFHDSLRCEPTTYVRVSVNQEQLDQLSHCLEIWRIEATPNFSVDLGGQTQVAVDNIAPIPNPVGDEPICAILDTGVFTNHPLLKGWVVHHEDFRLDTNRPLHGHGTIVAGIAVYGDLETQLPNPKPQVRVLSAAVLEHDNTYDSRFIEHRVEEVIRGFIKDFGCRVFNLSFGDLSAAYSGTHVRRFAARLDSLTRELGIVVVVCVHNASVSPADLQDYPTSLLDGSMENRIVDPSTALNALSVGGVARHEIGHNQQRFRTMEQVTPVRSDHPSPFTRVGPSAKNAIKPDVCAHAGNYALSSGRVEKRGLGVISTSAEFAQGKVLTQTDGTSFAAPYITHLAARLWREYPQGSANQIRALIAVNSTWPLASKELLLSQKPSAEEIDNLVSLIGYGVVDEDTLFRSVNDSVSLLAEDSIENNAIHVYELPLPTKLWAGAQRRREISIALAYMSATRHQRLAYKATRMEFRLVIASTPEEARDAFSNETKGAVSGISEFGNPAIGAQRRSAGTLQVDHWSILRPVSIKKKRVFVVVSRNDQEWSSLANVEEREAYALVAKVKDRENGEANLYVEMQEILKVRPRARV